VFFGGRTRPLAGIDLGLAAPPAQGLLGDTGLGCDRPDRFRFRALLLFPWVPDGALVTGCGWVKATGAAQRASLSGPRKPPTETSVDPCGGGSVESGIAHE